MAQLFFKKHFQDAIRAGTKRTTIRRWDRPMVQAEEIAFSPGLGWLRVLAVEMVELEKLSDADAKADGLETVAALRDILTTFYPQHDNDGKKWFRVVFTLSKEFRRSARDDDSQTGMF
ncbi:MAG TPA: ASCH domain-containing protein [Tepidisphaeraceae bacterium]|jgi:hypothetical protein|nr:ASCH domain-containing protein [Tepidisphaeraceae bacterium]